MHRVSVLRSHVAPQEPVAAGVAAHNTPQPAIMNRAMGQHQWYVHLSREATADTAAIRAAIHGIRRECANLGINLVIGFGPTLLKDLAPQAMPNDFQKYETFKSVDRSGLQAKGTQEELLIWMNSEKKDDIWQTQYDFRNAVKGNLRVARETMTFIYGNSLDMTGFVDGTGNPQPQEDYEVAIVPDGQPGAGGSHIIAQRWVHDLQKWRKLPLAAQEGVFGRTKNGSQRLKVQPAHSHLSHVELRVGKTGDESTPKRNQISRRSTPYAFPAPKEGGDGPVGLYFIGFCKEQAPLRERMRAMYGMDGQVRDKLTEYSNPASGSFYFAPSVGVLDAL